MSQNVPECPTFLKNKPLNPRKLLAIQYLACGKTPLWIEKQTKISRKTITRWKNQPEFQQELLLNGEKIRSRINEDLLDLAGLSINYLKEELGDPYTFGCHEDRLKISLNVLRAMANLVAYKADKEATKLS